MQLRIYISKYQYSCPCWQENIYGNPKKIFKSGSIHHSGHISRAGSQRDRTSVDILEFSPCEESYHEYFWIAATSGPALATLGSADLWAMFDEIPTLHKDLFMDLCQPGIKETSATEVGMLVCKRPRVQEASSNMAHRSGRQPGCAVLGWAECKSFSHCTIRREKWR